MDQKRQLTLKEFEDFFRENFQVATLIVFRYLENRSLAEDIVQESFVKLWEKQNSIDCSPAGLREYLFTIVRNSTISYLRSLKVKYTSLDVASISSDVTEEIRLYDEEELALRVDRAIDKLPRKCREIFRMAYLEELTYNEIAQKLSVSKNTIKTQMGIAYRILRNELRSIYLGLLCLFRKKRI
jgi:RNA polymerase sigma-70 factor (ECF subfamily)